MTKDRFFHFSLGPVQEFVGKARRLRDYWTGSFLLSYLTEQAMDEVCKNKGKIIFPPYEKGHNPTPGQGEGYPNRFQAIVPPDFDPVCCEQRVQKAWKDLAGHIWDHYVAPGAKGGKDTEEIWNRQVNDFWYLQWALSHEENDALLDQRKNWRSYIPTIEGGDKCTLMGNLQELSGYIRSSRNNEKKDQDDFWETMRNELHLLDLKDGERLCSIALIKRLFPRAYNDLNKTSLPESFPSTTYVSALGWMQKVMEACPDMAKAYASKARGLEGSASEARVKIQGLEGLVEKDPALRPFASMDGNLFYPHILENDGIWDKKTGNLRKALIKDLNKMNEKIGLKPDIYYGLLSMDGDRMGALLQDNKDLKADISQAIAEFSRAAPDIIEAHDGTVIYVGGEDVLAIFPVTTAVEAAIAIKNLYEERFMPLKNLKGSATISAAIIFAHHYTPLNMIYQKIQELLDSKAKEECGRASLAISTWNTNSQDLIWAMPWDQLILNKQDNLLRQVAQSLYRDLDEADRISNSFIYKLQRDFDIFTSPAGDLGFTRQELKDILLAEYLRARSKEKPGQDTKPQGAQELMEGLLHLCTPYYRDEKGQTHPRKGLNIDGALLAKFLARRWRFDHKDMGV